jgi:hypothetical protein
MASMHLYRRAETVDTGLVFDDSELLRYHLTDSSGKLLSVPRNARCWGQVAFHLKLSFGVPPEKLADGHRRLEQSEGAVFDLGPNDLYDPRVFDLIDSDP